MSKKIIIVCICLAVIFIFGAIIIQNIKKQNIKNDYSLTENLKVTSDAFTEGGMIPTKFTGRGEDISPNLKLAEISPDAKSIAVIMDDHDHPLGIYNHWVIWNIPVSNEVPEGISHGKIVNSLGGAVQGNGYGRHKYRGPKPPYGTHRYKFNVYVLDTTLDLSSDSGKAELVQSMKGHVLQYGSLTGKYENQ